MATHRPHTDRSRPLASWGDAALLSAPHDLAADAFGVLYERHLPVVLAFTRRRVGNAEIAADITAEAFAKALAARKRFDPREPDARSWLCTIAARLAIDAARRGTVEDKTRRRLGMEPLEFLDDDLERVIELSATAEGLDELEQVVSDLHPDLREAIQLRIVDGRDYSEIASGLATSESVIRKRVSRGLARLREELGGVR